MFLEQGIRRLHGPSVFGRVGPELVHCFFHVDCSTVIEQFHRHIPVGDLEFRAPQEPVTMVSSLSSACNSFLPNSGCLWRKPSCAKAQYATPSSSGAQVFLAQLQSLQHAVRDALSSISSCLNSLQVAGPFLQFLDDYLLQFRFVWQRHGDDPRFLWKRIYNIAAQIRCYRLI